MAQKPKMPFNPGEVTYDYYRHWYRTIIIVNEKYYFRQRFQHLYNQNIHDCSSSSFSVCCTSIDELHFVLHSEVFIINFGCQTVDDYNRTWQKVNGCFDVTSTGLIQKITVINVFMFFKMSSPSFIIIRSYELPFF